MNSFFRPLIVVPARYASSRFPGKPLEMLTGQSGKSKPLVEWSFEAAAKVFGASAVVVATDDARIAAVVRNFGGTAIMTDSTCVNGSERCADAMQSASYEPDVLVNFQGNAPLTPDWMVHGVIATLIGSAGADVATPVIPCSEDEARQMRAARVAGRSCAVTAVMNQQGQALMFSREPIPAAHAETPVLYRHVGLYAWDPKAILAFRNAPRGPLERAEDLEQLRVLEQGRIVQCCISPQADLDIPEFNEPADFPLLQNFLQ
jgi:3-deoxy-manno-octulosonate cytidylyltransferase (CMP-KDO synthetase)